MQATAWTCEQQALSPCFPPQNLYYLHLDPLLLSLTSLTACSVFHFSLWCELLFTHALLASPQSNMLGVFITFKPSTFLPFCPFAALPGAALGAELSPAAGAAPCHTQHPMWEGGAGPSSCFWLPPAPKSSGTRARAPPALFAHLSAMEVIWTLQGNWVLILPCQISSIS